MRFLSFMAIVNTAGMGEMAQTFVFEINLKWLTNRMSDDSFGNIVVPYGSNVFRKFIGYTCFIAVKFTTFARNAVVYQCI